MQQEGCLKKEKSKKKVYRADSDESFEVLIFSRSCCKSFKATVLLKKKKKKKKKKQRLFCLCYFKIHKLNKFKSFKRNNGCLNFPFWFPVFSIVLPLCVSNICCPYSLLINPDNGLIQSILSVFFNGTKKWKS